MPERDDVRIVTDGHGRYYVQVHGRNDPPYGGYRPAHWHDRHGPIRTERRALRLHARTLRRLDRTEARRERIGGGS